MDLKDSFSSFDQNFKSPSSVWQTQVGDMALDFAYRLWDDSQCERDRNLLSLWMIFREINLQSVIHYWKICFHGIFNKTSIEQNFVISTLCTSTFLSDVGKIDSSLQLGIQGFASFSVANRLKNGSKCVFERSCNPTKLHMRSLSWLSWQHWKVQINLLTTEWRLPFTYQFILCLSILPGFLAYKTGGTLLYWKIKVVFFSVNHFVVLRRKLYASLSCCILSAQCGKNKE